MTDWDFLEKLTNGVELDEQPLEWKWTASQQTCRFAGMDAIDAALIHADYMRTDTGRELDQVHDERSTATSQLYVSSRDWHEPWRYEPIVASWEDYNLNIDPWQAVSEDHSAATGFHPTGFYPSYRDGFDLYQQMLAEQAAQTIRSMTSNTSEAVMAYMVSDSDGHEPVTTDRTNSTDIGLEAGWVDYTDARIRERNERLYRNSNH